MRAALRQEIGLEKVSDSLRDCRFGGGAAAGFHRAATFGLCLRLRGHGAIALLLGHRFRRQRPISLADRIVALCSRPALCVDRRTLGGARPQRLPRARERARRERDEYRRDGGHNRRVPPDEFLKLVDRARRTSGDRFVYQIAAQVCRKGRREG